MLERSFLLITTPPKPNTPYGRKGLSSVAAQLASLIVENDFSPSPCTRYGEIWMGDHPSNSSSIILDDGSIVPLWKVISREPKRYLGVDVCKKFEDTPSGFEVDEENGESLLHLPFLFKVLSFERALPLQTHPDRALSAKLLRKSEKKDNVEGAGGNLVDHNYKPEVAVCISERFEGFIGFRPLLQIQGFLATVPELRDAIGDEGVVKEVLGLQLEDPSSLEVDEEKDLLKRLLSGIVRRKDEVIAEQCQKLATRLDEHGDSAVLGDKFAVLGKVIRKCLKDYPNDKGVFVGGFLMNLVSLKQGEGAVIGVDEIHAYVEGDIIECMAWGDNMLAHGFQPPEERSSAEAFIASVAYHTHSNPDLLSIPPSLVLPSEPWKQSKEGNTKHYLAPMDEFDLLHIRLAKKGEFEDMVPFPGQINGPLILLVVDGKAEIRTKDGKESRVMEKGRAVFVRPNVEWRITATAEEGADIWGAYVEVHKDT